MATTITGPVSKDVHAGGTTFSPKLKAPQGAMKKLTTSSEEARRTIMGMRVASTNFGGDPANVLRHKPKES